MSVNIIYNVLQRRGDVMNDDDDDDDDDDSIDDDDDYDCCQ